MKKRFFLLVPVIIIILALFFYFIPFEFTQSLRENLAYMLKNEMGSVEILETTVGITSEAQILDTNFMVLDFVTNLSRPTSIGFIGNDILVLEKNSGKVKLIRDGIVQEKPVLDVEVNFNAERGLLGITTVDSNVYLYFTKSDQDGGPSKGNHIYKYFWDGENLTNPVLMAVLPGNSATHNGGAMVTDLDENVLAVIGDQNHGNVSNYRILQNYQNGMADDTSVIFYVGKDPSVKSPSSTSNPLDHYYAMGIRNSFGLAIDPKTGNLWDTENGQDRFDEINFVPKKFNSGWARVTGPASNEQISKILTLDGFTYSDPEFSWEKTIAPTGIAFPNSEKFGNIQDILFVGDCNNGNLYKFKLNKKVFNF